jgi:CBS domain-containing protein
MRQVKEFPFVEDITRPVTTCSEDETVEDVAKQIIKRSINHIVVVDASGYLRGIVTSWDITRAVANGKRQLSEIITRKVVTATPDEPVDSASRKLAQHNISALPVVDSKGKVLGIVTSEDLSRLVRGI